MRILFICDEYPPGKTGGIGIAVQSIARALVSRGHTAFVAGLYDHGYGGQAYETDQGVRVWRLRYGPPGNRLITALYRRLPVQLRRMLNGERGVNRFMHFIGDLVVRENVNLVEIPDWHTFALYCGCVVRWPQLPVPMIVKSHGSYTYFNSELGIRNNPVLEANDRALFRQADRIVSVSQYTARKNLEIFSPVHPTDVLYNGVEVLANPLLERKINRVIFTGALSQKKGIHRLMEAWNLVIDKIPSAELHVYGKGKTRWLKTLLGPAKLKSVHFYGHVEKSEVSRALYLSRVAVFPSYSETFGLMAVEAMMAGCAVIYTRRSCGPEIINDKSDGLLIDPDRPEDIAAAIINLLQDTEFCERLSDAGRQSAIRRFSMDTVIRQHLDYYEKTIASFSASNK